MSVLTLIRQPAASQGAAELPLRRRTAVAVALPALLTGLLLSVLGYLAAAAAVVVTLLPVVRG